jgi:WD40 repeat protein
VRGSIVSTSPQPQPATDAPASDGGYDCFISYSRTDAASAAQLVEDLRSRQLNPWVDLDGLFSGEAFWPAICQAIETSQTFVFVMTSDSLVRTWCLRELSHAVEHNKRIIPVAAEPLPPALIDEMPAALKSRQWTFKRPTDDARVALDHLVGAIRTDPAWVRYHTHLLGRARDWEKAGRSKSFALRGEDLQAAEAWLGHSQGKEPPPAPLQAEYVIASRRQETAFRSKTLAAVLVALVIAVSLAITAYMQRQEAIEQRNEATRQRDLALARQLATEAELRRRERDALLPLSASLAVRSLRTVATAEGAQALRESIALLPMPIASLRHDSTAVTLVFSQDGSRLATASENGTIHVWDMTDGSALRRISAGARAAALRFSDDGTRLHVATRRPAGSSEESTEAGLLTVWDIASGRRLQRFELGGDVRAAAFDSGGRYLATGGGSGAILWDVVSGQRMGCFGPMNVTSLAFAPTGILVGTGTQVAAIWEAGECPSTPATPTPPTLSRRPAPRPQPPGRELVSLPDPGQVVVVASSPRAGMVATAAHEARARLWGGDQPRILTEFSHERNVRALAFSPSGDLLATGGEDRTARVWDLATRREITRVSHQSFVVALGFNPQGTLLATSSEDRTVRISRVRGERDERSLHHGEAVSAVSFSPDGRYLAIAGRAGALGLWDPMSLARLNVAMTHQKQYAVSSLAFSADGSLLASAGEDHTAQIWTVPAGKARVPPLRHGSRVFDVSFSADGARLATASGDRHARVWSTRDGSQLHAFRHDESVDKVIFGRDHRSHILATATARGAREFDVTSGRQLVVRPHDGLRTIAYRLDGRQLATGGRDKRVLLWQTTTSDPVRTLAHAGEVRLLAYSSDGAYLATDSASADSRGRHLTVWDARDGRQRFQASYEGVIWHIAFSPDNQSVVTAQTDHTVRVWSVGEQRETARFEHGDRVSSLAFSPDGRFLASGSWDQTVQLWLWRSQDLIAAACERLVLDADVHATACS